MKSSPQGSLFHIDGGSYEKLTSPIVGDQHVKKKKIDDKIATEN